ncbi:MAG: SDR family NAD(P)-dependent oxidoreductase [Eubacteriales bacterium]|nr:SDR family NAD(P)-dependent oxidoreductase [Eubacteriales bacterium]
MKAKNDVRPVAIITGAARNTGYATAERFAGEGYNVCITSRSGEDARKAASEIAASYPGAIVKGYEMPTTDIEKIRDVFRQLKSYFGRLDVLVANATATGYAQNILNTDPEDFDFVMSSNTRGYFFCCQEAAKIMVEQKKGSIVLVGSVHSLRPLPNRIVYAASKSAIDSFNRSIAVELGKYGIRCNCVIPGAIWNHRWIGLTENEIAAKRDNWPVGRESQPEDVANAIYFLASDQASTITGTNLVVDSGVSANLLKYDKNWDKE